jgi:chromatin segregation and condensation protein Rec8/ScpA/Scc1 (kleisin family)
VKQFFTILAAILVAAAIIFFIKSQIDQQADTDRAKQQLDQDFREFESKTGIKFAAPSVTPHK